MQKHEEGPISTAGDKPLRIVNGYVYQGKFRVTTQFINSCRVSVNDFTTKVSYLIYNFKRASRGRDYSTGHSQNCDQLHSGPNPWHEEAKRRANETWQKTELKNGVQKAQV